MVADYTIVRALIGSPTSAKVGTGARLFLLLLERPETTQFGTSIIALRCVSFLE